ncbi:MAG TPA: hypothetical protein VMW10_10625 [Alphaproteobacteria bacterium]|nr:hypothetical protein [Alphaproteobacteria bacterium]
MYHQILKGFFLICLWLGSAHAEEFEDVSSRFHAQWDVGDPERQKLLEIYGALRVQFDQNGYPTPHGLSPELMQRWHSFYELCMRDGCYYCDADLGSCETGTCGPENANCRPYVGSEGLPKCGDECSDYAFASTLS